jgi:hypothetical protein
VGGKVVTTSAGGAAGWVTTVLATPVPTKGGVGNGTATVTGKPGVVKGEAGRVGLGLGAVVGAVLLGVFGL